MTDPIGPLRTAVQQGNRYLLPVCIVALLAGTALALVDGSVLWRLFGLATAATGAAFLVVWMRGRDADAHPLVRVVRDQPQRVEWVHRVVRGSAIGGPDRATLHVGLDDGQTFELPVEDPALAIAAEEAIVARCPRAARRPTRD